MKISVSAEEEILILDICKYFVYLLNILCQQQRKDHVRKSVVAAMEFTIENKHFIKWSWMSNKYRAKCFWDVSWQKMKIWWAKDNDQENQYDIFNFACTVK